ncbi:hypothetical protein [Tessaracoccus coleopterorum]|uniref:hypothetical protein n=1 Tax=Tessaracoccus coleopterorum TaxID=2714950 RepID=UPI0018D45515
MTCNADGERITRDLFGDDVLWVGYVDPGLPLARLIKRRREEFTSRTGQEPPKATFLMNHGLIVSGDSPTTCGGSATTSWQPSSMPWAARHATGSPSLLTRSARRSVPGPSPSTTAGSPPATPRPMRGARTSRRGR